MGWLGGDSFSLSMSDPHWGPDVRALVEPAEGIFRPLPPNNSSLEPAGPPRPLAELGPWMEEEIRTALAASARQGEDERAERARPSRRRQYFAACICLLIALLAVLI